MTQTGNSRTKVLGLLLATVVAFSATAGVGGFAGVASAATNTNVAVSIPNASDTVAPNGATTVEIAVTNADGGVGAAELGVELSNPGVATITDVEILHDPGPTDNFVTDQSADLKWAFANSPDTGQVTIVEVTLQGVAPGSTDINVVENSQTGNLVIGDERGATYTLDNIGSATLTVADIGPGEGDVSVRLDGTDGDSLIAAGTTNTYDVVVEGVNGGVGAFSLTVSSGNTSVATITDASVEAPASGGTDLTDISVSDSSATLEAAVRDTDDTGDVTIANVTVTGQSAGTASIDLSVSAIGNESGAPYTVTSETGASLDVIELPKVDPGFPGVPTDPDDDGKFEDVNGDGDVSVVDVQALWSNRNDPSITDFGERYDFNDDGEFNVIDVQGLWNELNA